MIRPCHCLPSFCRATGAAVCFDDLDRQAVEAGLGALANENDTFRYPIIGRHKLTLTISRDLGSDEVSVQITGRRDRLLGAADD
jgi:hypothetical protein